jgi:glutathione peroxidase
MANELSALALTRLDGSSDSLAQHAGKVLLVVNVASQCGLTPQYEGLEKLYTSYREQGFEVLGFPANDFGNQEPGSAEDIDQFCKVNYGVSFPLFAKAPCRGREAAALRGVDRGRAGQAGAGGGVSREAEGLWHRSQ